MKKIALSSLLVGSLFALDFNLVSGLTSVVKSSTSALGMDGEVSTTNVDTECKKLFESYDLNIEGLLAISATYGVANSNKMLNFLNDTTNDNKKKSEDLKKFAIMIAKNYLWIPLEVEKMYGDKIYEDRIASGDVILKTTKNSKYKKMYSKIDEFTKKYNQYLKEQELSYPYDIKIYILSAQKKAESLPYGYIFISEDYIENGMYETILAHELAHVSKRHATKEIQYRIVSTYDNITDITNLIKNMQDKEILKKIETGLMTPDIIKKSFEFYAQEQEIEADSCGLKTINAFVPNQKEIHVENFISNVNNSENKDQKAEVNFKNHPDKEARIENIKYISKLL